jgi:hypothetical protein
MSSPAKSPASLGFLTVVEHAELGLVGGYLLLNASGRPLEFHCTAPVKPNRAQEILYGIALKPYLYGEQIGQTLLNKSKQSPVLVCTDNSDVLAVRDHTPVPVALVLAENADEERPHLGSALSLGRNRLALPQAYASDETTIREHWPHQADALDLAEPFVRIREALEEAQKVSRAA